MADPSQSHSSNVESHGTEGEPAPQNVVEGEVQPLPEGQQGEAEPTPEPEPEKTGKEPIPDTFFYDNEELWRRPVKSDDNLPDNLMTLYHSFGYACRMRRNLHALDDQRLAFAAGGFLIILEHDRTRPVDTSYLPTTGGGSIGALAMHPSGRLLAVGEKGVNPVVNIFEVHAFQLYRILREGTTRGYTALAFNDSGDLLASQGGDPDYMLTVWNWKQEAIMLRCKAFAQEVNHVSFNKDMAGDLTTAGSGHIKFWHMAYTFTGLKLKGAVGRFGRTALSDIEGYVEFPDGKVLSGSDWGNLLLWDENLIKLQICRKNGKPCHAGPIMHMLMEEGEVITAGTDGFVRSWNWELIDVLEAGEESGMVEMEAMNEELIGSGARLYYLTKPPILHEPPGTAAPSVQASPQTSQNLDEIAAAKHTWYAQDGTGSIWQADLSFSMAAKAPKCMDRFHAGAVVACAVSPVTHLMMTLGKDGWLHLYDFLLKKMISSIQIKAKGTCLVWIPVSLDRRCATVLAGFSDGGIRRVAIDNRPDPEAREPFSKCSLKLMMALKPHEGAVTHADYSLRGGEKDSSGVSTTIVLATVSVDRTIFFFQVTSEDIYTPWCYVPLDAVPREILWSTEQLTGDHLMLICDESVVVEMVVPKTVTTQDTLKTKAVCMRIYKFPSVKSKFLHEEQLQEEAKKAEEMQKQQESANRELLEKGLETPSQQNLRLEAERQAAEQEKKETEESGEEWVQFIPKVPSNILQGVYSDPDNRFWLLLDDYDAGFAYECQFSEASRYWDTTLAGSAADPPVESHDPLRVVRVEGAEDLAVTAMCFNSDGTLVFFGLKNGQIRLQFLENEYDLGAVRSYWSLGVHDVTHGAVRSLTLSHDELFLVSGGADGNVFVFCLVPPEQLCHEIVTTEAVVPKGKVDTPDGKPVNDLIPNQYTIEQAKQKSEHDRQVALAEANKQKVRQNISDLRGQFKKLLIQNSNFPQEHRLSRDEFTMDHLRLVEVKQDLQEKLQEVTRQTAWDTEKAAVGLKKLRDYYMQGMKSDRFCVRNIGGNYCMWSYRVREDISRRVTRAQRSRTYSVMQQTPEDSMETKALKENLEQMEAEIRCLVAAMEHQASAETLRFMSQRTAYLLKKCNALKIKRAKRKMAWLQFLATKPHDDYEDPVDVEAIIEAHRTMGFRCLKSDPTFKVPENYLLDKNNGATRLNSCEFYLAKAQADFNKKLTKLRDEKQHTLMHIEEYCTSLLDVQSRLPESQHKSVPNIMGMQLDEQPELHYELSGEAKRRLQLEAHRVSCSWTQEFMQQVATMGASSARGKRLSFFANKSERKTSYSIAKESFRQLSSDIRGMGSVPDIPSSSGVPTFQEMPYTPSALELEMQNLEQIHLEYRQDVLLKNINDLILRFDIKHRELRHEKFKLDVLVKQGELRSNTLQAEFLLLSKCEVVETGIQARIDTCLDQKMNVDRDVKNLTNQIYKINRDLEELARRDAELFHNVSHEIGDPHPFRDFLLRVYKKKVKRKKPRPEGEESASDSDSESSSDDDMDDEDDEENEGANLDLGACPPKCNVDLYNKVVELRWNRVDNDEVAAELRRQKDSLTKELDSIGKRKQQADVILLKAEKELELYQIEKQQMVNALDVVAILQLHQIQCLKENGDLPSLTEELCLDETEVLRLQNRIRELHKEKKAMKKAMAQRRKHHIHLMHEKDLFQERLAKMDEECNAAMVKKFGRMVDLEEVEVVPADHEVEDVRIRLFKSTMENRNAMHMVESQLADIQYDKILQMRICSEYTMVEALQRKLKQDLEKSLNNALRRNRVTMDESSPVMEADLKLLAEVVAEQKNVLNVLHQEIEFLVAGDDREESSSEYL